MRELAILLLLNELILSDDVKPTGRATRDWVKRKRGKGYVNFIIKELRVGYRFNFRKMSWKDVTNFENVFAKI